MSDTRRWQAIWVLLVISSGFYFFSNNQADNDLWIHVRVGLDVLASGVPRVDSYSYTAAGSAWIDHEWLLHALFGLLFQFGGGAALLLFKLAVGFATLAFLAVSVTRRSLSVHISGAVLVIATAVLARGFAIRPQIATYLAVAGLWCFLDSWRRDTPWRWLLVPFFVVWANAHAGVLIGLVMSMLCAAWITLSRPRQGFSLAAITIIAAVGALVLNPYGFAYANYLWRELGFPHPITEWQPAALEPAQGGFFLLAALFLLSLPFLRAWRERGWEAILAGGLLVGAMAQQRHTPVFALCAAPVIAEAAGEAVALLSRATAWRLSAPPQRVIAVGLIAVAAFQLAMTVELFLRDRLSIVFDPADYPLSAVQRIAETSAPANLAVPLGWGGYALWHLAPRVKVSLDGRFATVYSPQVVEDNFAFFSDRDNWKRLIEAYPTDAVLAPANAPPPVLTMPGWRQLYADDVAVLFARDNSPLAAAFSTSEVHRAPLPSVFP